MSNLDMFYPNALQAGNWGWESRESYIVQMGE